MVNKKIKSMVSLVLLLMILMPIVSAGPGLKWSQESILAPEKDTSCLTYSVYNPWPRDSYVQIGLSEELRNITKSSESETKFVPANTASADAIPVEFCFKTPSIYTEDCLIGDFLICEQTCSEDMKVFEGKVEVMELSEEEAKIDGAGGSATQMSVSAPLRVRVQCVPYDRNYGVVYALVALIAGILLWINVSRKKSKKNPKKKSREELKKELREEIKEELKEKTKKKSKK